jgi:arabinan endo-1,5-alpha-L-arabinosidase
MWNDRMATERRNAPARPVAGDFRHIYDPSVDEDEPWYINDHTFVRDRAGMWHLFGITHAEPLNPFEERLLAHATAPTLHGPWTKQPYALSAEEAWGETQLWAPHVIEHDGQFWMFVCGGGTSHTEYRIQLATSPDCWSWARHPENPLVVDGFLARDPMVIALGERWVMYYTATTEPHGGQFVVAALESTDLVRWSNRRLVYTDPQAGTYGGPTESPFVVERAGWYYLLIGPNWEGMEKFDVHSPSYRRTRAFASQDPLAFDVEDEVGVIDAHAAEVIVDEQGAMWVSHCGWGQAGVYLAPLQWTE